MKYMSWILSIALALSLTIICYYFYNSWYSSVWIMFLFLFFIYFILFIYLFIFFKDGTSRAEEDNSINNMREVENSLDGNPED